MQVPPHNGFGDEVDSLGYVYDLVPKKPKIDFFKYVDNDKKILRYTARFNTKVPEDLDRRFIISFYFITIIYRNNILKQTEKLQFSRTDTESILSTYMKSPVGRNRPNFSDPLFLA